MEQKTSVGQRFSELIAHLGISKNAFAMSLDKTATVIQHLVDERNKPGFDLLCKVFEVYPNVSKEWLLEGNGPMIRNGSAPAPVSAPEPARGVAASLAPAASATVAAPAPEPAPAAQPAPAPVAEAADEPAGPPVSAPPAVVAAPAPAAVEAGWQSALYTQQMAHQLALAELRNQHLQEQQRLMQQMLDLMQRQLGK